MTRLWGSALENAQPYGLPFGDDATFGARRDGRQEIEKRSFGGPCFEGTLRIRDAFRMKSRGRDD